MRHATLFLGALVVAGCANTGPRAVEPFPESAAVPAKSCADRPAVVLRAEPSYPPQAYQEFQSGWVILEYDIASDGTTTGIEVVRSSPPELFDGVSRRALREWRFPPNMARQKCRMDFRFSRR